MIIFFYWKPQVEKLLLNCDFKNLEKAVEKQRIELKYPNFYSSIINIVSSFCYSFSVIYFGLTNTFRNILTL